jgi:glycosyltransferase involved in cell wall biosynthesis
MNDISVIIPVREEECCIDELLQRLTSSVTSITKNYEIIFITDINRDKTFEVLTQKASADKKVKVIKLSNSFGQHVAIIAGLRNCDGKYAVLMDGDLQDCPEDIPLLYAKTKEGYNIVYAVKKDKNTNLFRNILSKTFNFIMRKFSDIRYDVNSSIFRIISRKAINEILKFKEIEPSITYIFGYMNLSTASIMVSSGCRTSGRTKYSFGSLMRFGISSLISFSSKPLYFISQVGFVIALAGLAYMIYIFLRYAIIGIPVSGWATIVFLVLFVGGMQLISIGVLGEYLGRVYMQTKNRPLYIIESKIGDFGRNEADDE